MTTAAGQGGMGQRDAASAAAGDHHVANPWSPTCAFHHRTIHGKRSRKRHVAKCNGFCHMSCDNSPLKNRLEEMQKRMTTKEERKCLAEIKAMSDIEGTEVLSSGLTVEEFALYYVLTHHFRRNKLGEGDK